MDFVPRPGSPETSFRRRSLASNEVQLEQLREDIAARLRRVCGEMTPEQFEALVSDICAMKIRWAQSEAPRR